MSAQTQFYCLYRTREKIMLWKQCAPRNKNIDHFSDMTISTFFRCCEKNWEGAKILTLSALADKHGERTTWNSSNSKINHTPAKSLKQSGWSNLGEVIFVWLTVFKFWKLCFFFWAGNAYDDKYKYYTGDCSCNTKVIKWHWCHAAYA